MAATAGNPQSDRRGRPGRRRSDRWFTHRGTRCRPTAFGRDTHRRGPARRPGHRRGRRRPGPPPGRAYNAAATEAHDAGVSLWITSGYRTPAEQEALWEDGLQTYGSPEAARRWVLPPDESTHVTGEAIDVGPREGAQWLEDNGSHWGLCRMYDNEWWHYELATTPDGPCPSRLPDAGDR
ncbi:M15 family metallopeptidase [Nocardia sp. CA-151230]|uniref:M15 family metallopeptidase n=1 Tax=Nocardia sp. CA-151230 TaxID=3239982 RepID=UPI003D9165C7